MPGGRAMSNLRAKRHHVECVTELAQATFGDLTDAELLRRLIELGRVWDLGKISVGEARQIAMLIVEKARRAGRAGGSAMSAPFVFCQFCSNRAAWEYRPCRWVLCSACRKAAELEAWPVLAGRWRRKFPRVHIPNAAAVIEANLARATVAELCVAAL
jgi:hypothetical protein